MIVDREDHLDRLDFAKSGGLLPLIAQHAATGEILMLGYADREALSRTLKQKALWFYSRSRDSLWRKGETSGNTLHLESLHADCDRDALVALVTPSGPTCHSGARTCFAATPTIPALADVLDARHADFSTDAHEQSQKRPAAERDHSSSYTVRLFGDENLRLKKLGEEAMELALACATRDRAAVAEEAADLLYHLMVASRAAGVSAEEILEVLARRRGAATAEAS
jgi:phosphoribosyl-ATP pyrophosphohydrolase/phosphoribosyl-AMP cyclohydrolase